MAHSVSTRHASHAAECRRLAVAANLSLKRFILLHHLRKYSPDQPRDQWGRWVDTDPDTTGGTVQLPEITARERSGDPQVDGTSDELADIAEGVLAAADAGSGAFFGTRVHAAFASAVRAADIPGIRSKGVEASWGALGEIVRYGLDGSVRTDITLHKYADGTGPVLAVWDLKTGSAKLTASRIQQIRETLGIGPEVPVFELHVDRGITAKSAVSLTIWGDTNAL